MSRRPATLYHFTSHPRWHFIKSVGIDRGEAPISFTEVLNFPNLTSNPEPLAQRWAPPGADYERKLAIRIAVEIPQGDDNLISWRDFADLYGMDRKYYRTLDRAGGWEARNWWIYRGTISPERFTDVEFLHDQPNEFERLMLEVFEVSADFDEALRRMGCITDANGFKLISSPGEWDVSPTRRQPAHS